MERVTRIVAVAFVAVGGLVHLQLWRSGYRFIPHIGTWFIANVVVSAVLAALVLLRNDIRVRLAGILFSVASLGALVMSHTVGLFGYTERGWSARAVQATSAELGAVVALALLGVMLRLPEVRAARV